jgi:hypothetical protein
MERILAERSLAKRYERIFTALKSQHVRFEDFRDLVTQEVYNRERKPVVNWSGIRPKFFVRHVAEYPASCQTNYDRWVWDLYSSESNSFDRTKLKVKTKPSKVVTKLAFPCCYMSIEGRWDQLPNIPVCPHCVEWTKKSKVVEWKHEKHNPRRELERVLNEIVYADLASLILMYVSHPRVMLSVELATTLRNHIDAVGRLTNVITAFDRCNYTLTCHRTYNIHRVLLVEVVMDQVDDPCFKPQIVMYGSTQGKHPDVKRLSWPWETMWTGVRSYFGWLEGEPPHANAWAAAFGELS